MSAEVSKLDSLCAWLRCKRHDLMTFLGYAVTGGLTQVIDLGSFLGFVRLHVAVEVATTAAICIATATHFALNKYINFKSFNRPVTQQLGTYLVVGAMSLTLSVTIVSLLTRGFHSPPIVAKIAAVVIAFPFNYLCHKYLTFAGGFRSVFAAWKVERRAKQTASTQKEILDVPS